MFLRDINKTTLFVVEFKFHSNNFKGRNKLNTHCLRFSRAVLQPTLKKNFKFQSLKLLLTTHFKMELF